MRQRGFGGVRKNISFSRRRRGGAGIRGAGFRWRPAIWRPVFASSIPSVEPHWESAFTAGTNRRTRANVLPACGRASASTAVPRAESPANWSAGFQHGAMVKQTATSRAGGRRSGADSLSVSFVTFCEIFRSSALRDVRTNTSFSPRRTGGAGIRGAGFRWRPAVWWRASPSGCQTTQSRARANAGPNDAAPSWRRR